VETIGSVQAIREFFGTSEKPVEMPELRALGVQGINELAPACAEALGKALRATGK